MLKYGIPLGTIVSGDSVAIRFDQEEAYLGAPVSADPLPAFTDLSAYSQRPRCEWIDLTQSSGRWTAQIVH